MAWKQKLDIGQTPKPGERVWSRPVTIRAALKEFDENPSVRQGSTAQEWVDFSLYMEGKQEPLANDEVEAMNLRHVAGVLADGKLKTICASMDVFDVTPRRADAVTDAVHAWEGLTQEERESFGPGIVGWVGMALRDADLGPLTKPEKEALEQRDVDNIKVADIVDDIERLKGIRNNVKREVDDMKRQIRELEESRV